MICLVFERNQHINVQQQIDDEQIKKMFHHQEFLFHNIFGKIGQSRHTIGGQNQRSSAST